MTSLNPPLSNLIGENLSTTHSGIKPATPIKNQNPQSFHINLPL
jgi:hypothetical protein